MGLHQSSKSKYKYSKYFIYSRIKTLQASYIPSFGIKNQMYSMQYTLYEDYYSICEVKVCFIKRNFGEE